MNVEANVDQAGFPILQFNLCHHTLLPQALPIAIEFDLMVSFAKVCVVRIVLQQIRHHL